MEKEPQQSPFPRGRMHRSGLMFETPARVGDDGEAGPSQATPKPPTIPGGSEEGSKKGTSSIHSSKGKSPAFRRKEIDQQIEMGLVELEEEVDNIQQQIRIMEAGLSGLEAKLGRKNQVLSDINPVHFDAIHAAKTEILAIKEEIEDRKQDLKMLNMRLNDKRKANSRRKGLLLKSQALEHERIDEDDEQADVDVDLQEGLPKDTIPADQRIHSLIKDAENLKAEEAHKSAAIIVVAASETKAVEGAAVKEAEQAAKKKADLEVKKKALMAKLEASKAAIATAKAKEDKAKSAEEKVKAEAEKAKTEANKAAAEQTKLEEELRALNVGGEASSPRTPATGTTVSGEERIIQLLLQAVHSPHASGGGGGQVDNSKFIARHSYGKDLPHFSGKAEDWPVFKADFERSTQDCGFSNSENLSRLRKCLKGDAAQYVLSLMVSPDNVPQIIKDLGERYGQPEHIIRAMVEKASRLPAFKQDDLDALINFGSAVRNLTATVKTLERAEHLCNPQLQKELEDKLPPAMVMVWMRWVKAEVSRKRDLENFSTWISEEVSLACQVRPPQAGTEVKPQAVGILKSPELKKKVKFVEDIPTAATLFSGDRPFGNREWKSKCIFCGKHSDSSTCIRASDMHLDENLKVIVDAKCCSICFNPSHNARTCKTFVACVYCKKKHYTFMCPDLPVFPKTNKDKKDVKKGDPATTTSTNLVTSSDSVILQTFMVTAVGRYGIKRVRVLLDTGAQRSFILKELAEELGLPVIGEETTFHTVFMGAESGLMKHKKYNVQLLGVKGRGSYYLTARDQNKICGVIPTMPKGSWMKELKKYKLSSHDFDDEVGEIEIMIGADQVEGFMTGKRHRLSNGLTIKETVFGWCLIGETAGQVEGSVAMMSTSMFVTEASVEQLWDLDTIGIRDPAENKTKKEKDELTKKHFLETVTRSEDGRYTVTLPWIDGRPNIPSNRRIAELRLDTATAKLNSLGVYQDYDKLFTGWESEGIIEVVPAEELDNPSHYIPHRAVLKPESLTTPIRPVFDASCKSQRAPSLNDCLEKGPNLLELIPSILLKFRIGMMGMIADIRKAFQMIDVDPADRDYLRFLWWEDPSRHTYKVYRHRRVVFGVNCSPFLLAAVLEHLLSHVPGEDEALAKKILKSLYVDNVVTSVESLEEGLNLKEWATDLLAEGKMELRCWEGGFAEESGIGPLVSRGCGLDFGIAEFQEDSKKITSVLGYKWDKVEDSLFLDLDYDRNPDKVSKKIILSYAHRVFDPIGFTGPATLQLKLLLRQLWAQKVSWDEKVQPEVEKEFRRWIAHMEFLQQIRIPRNMTGCNNNREDWQIHTFCDASKSAYAAVVFLRADNGSDVAVQLMMAKSRVAPLKDISINRLELLSCFVGARLTDSIKKDLGLQNVPVTYWSDSSTALAWIRRNDEWGTFVGNRVKTILSLTDSNQWRHVPGVSNPADLPSRGCTPLQLLESSWWEGPEWLKESAKEWPTEDVVPIEEDVLAERKKTVSNVTTLTVVQTVSPWYAPNPIFWKNVVVMAWILRFGKKPRTWKENDGDLRFLTMLELEEAEKTIIKMVQKDAFPKEATVIGNIQVKKEDGLYLVKSRLEYREDTDQFWFPILLPHDHPVVDHLILEIHLKNHHAGTQFIMEKLREKYWVLKGRRAVSRIVDKCVVCRRFSAKQPHVVPAPLPVDRVKTSKVFETVGVDFAGPLYIKRTLKEKKSGEEPGKVKAWIVLFTCSVYRCVRLELVKSLSTEAFMEAFSRFMARRGRPTTVYSDNGTNFTGLNNAMKSLDWEMIQRKYALDRIQWKFNPPAAPWWGGFWERMVRSVKELLRKSLGRSSVTYQELETCICEIEATINGRPLTVVTENPDDLTPLTPAMFLHEMKYPCVTDQELLTASGFQKLFQRKQTYLEDIKKRFRKEYLALLVHRGKEQKIKHFQIGDLVFIGSDDKKRVNWPLAKIVEFYPGKDGHVRAAKLKTANGFLDRPIQWLIPMEISSPQDIPEAPQIEDNAEEDSHQDLDAHSEDIPQPLKTRSGRVIKRPVRLGY